MVAAFSSLAVTCGGDQGGYVVLYDEPPPETRDIDEGARFSLDGVGLAIEALAGGHWRLAATCDSEKSSYTCYWDVVASVAPGNALSVVTTSFDDGDGVLPVDEGAVRIVFATTRRSAAELDAGVGGDPGTDGGGDAGIVDAGSSPEGGAGDILSETDEVVLAAPPGEALRVDVLLDGVHDATYVAWTEGGLLRAGFPTNPTVLAPTPPPQ
jgi:hypothetical protein